MKVTGLYVFETHSSLGINEVPIHGSIVVIDYKGETKILTKLLNSGLNSLTTIEDFYALEDHWDFLGKPSELELIEENGIKGWRLYKRDPLDYGVIGKDAIDFNITDGNFAASGATGDRSFASGFNSHAMGEFSHAEGYTTLQNVDLITGPQGGGGPGGNVPEGGYRVYGVPEGAYAVYGVPEGAYAVYGVPEGAYAVYGAS